MRLTDIVPINSNGPTTTVPPAKERLNKVFTVKRTDTTATLKAMLPASATIVDISIYTSTASNAGTSASISIGSTSANSNEYVNAQDVKTAAGYLRPSTAIQNIFNVQPVPLGLDLPIYAKYVEAGTASSAGGDWYVIVEYIC